MIQQMMDRIEAIEKLLAGKHPDEKGFLAELALKYGTDEEKAAQAAKAAADAAKK